VNHSIVLVEGGAVVELLAAGGAGHVFVHVDVHVHRLHVALEVHLAEECSPAEVALVVLYLPAGVSIFILLTSTSSCKK